MKVSIEKREPDKDGKQSLRLVYYFGASIDPETGKRIRYRRREPLELYLFQKTKTPQQRQHNKETMRLAEAIKAKRLLESQSGKHGFDDSTKLSASFFDYYQKITDLKASVSKSNYFIWISALKHLRVYHAIPELTFEQITPQFLEDFRTYL